MIGHERIQFHEKFMEMNRLLSNIAKILQCNIAILFLVLHWYCNTFSKYAILHMQYCNIFPILHKILQYFLQYFFQVNGQYL